MNILLSPHDDDSILFASFICIREKPLVIIVTDSYIQPNRGEVGCSAWERAEESRKAHQILDVPVVRLGFRDDTVKEFEIADALRDFKNVNKVYAPALQGGNIHHDMVSIVAQSLFKNTLRQYTTYTKTELYTTGGMAIEPTEEELQLKEEALNCYQSQLSLNATWPHFKAIGGKPEWLL